MQREAERLVACGHRLDQVEPGAVDCEHRDLVAARVHRIEEAAVAAQPQPALGVEIDTDAQTARAHASDQGQSTVGLTAVDEDAIGGGGIAHRKHHAGRPGI